MPVSAVRTAGRDGVCHRVRRRHALRTERGSATAEAAMVIPLLAGLVLCLCWLVTVGIAQVQLVDAARDSARGLARGEDRAAVDEHVQRTAAGAAVDVYANGDTITTTVTSSVDPPGWLLVPLPAVALRAESTVLREEGAHETP